MAWREVRRNFAPNPNMTWSLDGYTFEKFGGGWTGGTMTHAATGGINDSASMLVSPGTGGSRVIGDPLRLERGETFTASINVTGVTGTDGTARIRVAVFVNGARHKSGDYFTVPQTPDGVVAVRPFVTFTVPDGAPAVRIVVDLPDDAAAAGVDGDYSMTLDDLLIERGDVVSTYFDGDINMGGHEPPQYRNRWVGTADGWNAVIEEQHVVTPTPNSGYFLFGNFLTGKIAARSGLVTSLDGEMLLNEPAMLGFTARLPWFDPVTGTTIDVPNESIPYRDFIAYVENDEIILGGPVTVDDHTFPAHAVNAKDPWEYFNRRYVLPPLADGETPSDALTRWTDLTIPSIGKRLIEQAMQWEGGNVPVDVAPSDVAGGHERTYPGEDMVPVGVALTNLTAVVDGSDFMFRPKWGAGRTHVRWELLSGSPLSPGGTDHYWDLSNPDPWATATSYRRSGEDLNVNSFVIGAEYQNMLANPSFINASGGVPEDWAAEGAAVSFASNVVFDESRSLSLDLDGLTATLKQDYPARVLPGAHYSAQAWVRSRSQRPPTRVRVDWLNADGATISTSTSAWAEPETGEVWTPLHASGIAPSNATDALFSVEITDTMTGGAVFVGGTMLVEGDTAFVKYARDIGVVEAWTHNPALLDAGYPVLDAAENRGSVTKSDTATAHAQELALRGSYQLETFSMAVRRDTSPSLGAVWPGDFARINFGDNHRVAKGMHEFRILRVAFAATGDVTLEFAPLRATGGYSVPASNRRWLAGRLQSMSSRIRESESLGFTAY